MFETVFWIVVIIHLIIALIFCLLVMLRRTHLRGEYIIPILLVPIFGPLLALVIELVYLFGKSGQKTLEIEALKLENDIYWKPLKQSVENTDIVPLEESILINDYHTRRKAMFEIQEQDPINFLDILLLARENDDVETVHYATTQISKGRKKFELELQKLAVATEEDPQNLENLDQYLDLYNKYIDSGLFEDELLQRERLLFSELLDKKLSLVGNDRLTLIRKLRNSVNLGNFTMAEEISDLLKENWPEEEATWIESLRASVEAKDQKRFLENIHQIKQKTATWTKPGKEIVGNWISA